MTSNAKCPLPYPSSSPDMPLTPAPYQRQSSPTLHRAARPARTVLLDWKNLPAMSRVDLCVFGGGIPSRDTARN